MKELALTLFVTLLGLSCCAFAARHRSSGPHIPSIQIASGVEMPLLGFGTGTFDQVSTDLYVYFSIQARWLKIIA